MLGGGNGAPLFSCDACPLLTYAAHNVLEYIDVLWRLLRPGGVWINLGPLLWHWADAHTYLAEPELSLELPLDTVLRCAAARGFQLERRQSRFVPIYRCLHCSQRGAAGAGGAARWRDVRSTGRLAQVPCRGECAGNCAGSDGALCAQGLSIHRQHARDDADGVPGRAVDDAEAADRGDQRSGGHRPGRQGGGRRER